MRRNAKQPKLFTTPTKHGIEREPQKPECTETPTKVDRATPGSNGLPRSILELPPMDPERAHFASCERGPSTCSRCKFGLYKKQWMSNHPLDPENPMGGSWLVTRLDATNNNFYLGCAACHAAGKGKSFGTISVSKFFQNASFVNHERTSEHVEAVALTNGACRSDLLLQKAPPQQHFEDVLRSVWSGKCRGRDGMPGVGKLKKVRKMKWCLAEARRAKHRSLLARASTMSIHQDATKGCIAARFICCGLDLEPHAGMLGFCSLAEHYSLNATGLKNVSLQVIADACTPDLNIPYKKQLAPPTVDKNLQKHVLQIVELWDTDAAEDEVLAGKYLAGVRGVDAGQLAGAGEQAAAAMPNLRVRNRDKPHGARRLCSRTWKADDFLESIAQTIVIKKKSIMNVIRYSDIYKHRFEKHVRNMETNPTTANAIRDISSAKHRFESMSKPFGRGCILARSRGDRAAGPGRARRCPCCRSRRPGVPGVCQRGS